MLGPDGATKSAGEISTLFESKGVDVSKAMVFSCGAGCMATLAYATAVKAGFTGQLYLYDGSWAEYSIRKAKE